MDALIFWVQIQIMFFLITFPYFLPQTARYILLYINALLPLLAQNVIANTGHPWTPG